MVKHLTQHGNSTALVIDKAVLELLHITTKTPLELSRSEEHTSELQSQR